MLRPVDVRGILHTGGTILGTTNHGDPFKFPVKSAEGVSYVDRSMEVVANAKKLKLEGLIVIGGDGTLRIGLGFHELGLPVVGVPKTIDNDVEATVVTFGFDTAVSVATEALDRLHTTAFSHRRVMVLEVMGRNVGWIALHAGMAGGADVILIPEIPFDIESVCEKIRDRARRGRRFSIVVVAEGATPAGGEQKFREGASLGFEGRLGGIAEIVADRISQRTGHETRSLVLGHLQRGGRPTNFDRLLGTRFGSTAARLAHEGRWGDMVCLAPPNVMSVPLKKAVLILDRSGSMQGRKLGFVKEAATQALMYLTPDDVASVVTYDRSVNVLAPAQFMTAEARSAVLEKIETEWAGGQTNLSLGWFTGCDQIADHMTPARINRALLLTDGLANSGITDVETLVQESRELRRRGITTTTFGVGEEFNQFLLQGLADSGGGHFYFIDDAERIANSFAAELGELVETVARNIVVDIGVPASAEIEVLEDLPNERQNNTFRIHLGDAFSNETLSAVLHLELRPLRRAQNLLLPVSLSYDDAIESRNVTIDEPPVLFRGVAESEAKRAPVNDAVVQAACRSEVDRAKMHALHQDYEGDADGAQGTLGIARGTIGSLVPPATAAPYVDEIAELGTTMLLGMDELARKQQHYHTYRSLRGRRDRDRSRPPA